MHEVEHCFTCNCGTLAHVFQVVRTRHGETHVNINIDPHNPLKVRLKVAWNLLLGRDRWLDRAEVYLDEKAVSAEKLGGS